MRMDKLLPYNGKTIQTKLLRTIGYSSKEINKLILNNDLKRTRRGYYLVDLQYDIDFKLILKAYECNYEILECYYSVYNYLPKLFINFVLDKYVLKTQYKGVVGKEIEYNRQKSLFNSLYRQGMAVTNNIKDEVTFDNITGWTETPITNEEIIKKLQEEEKARAFK